MKKINPTFKKLINLLNDLDFHSGSALGEKLSISRSAVWKYVQQITHANIPISTDKARGYRLSCPLTLLDEFEIRKNIKQSTNTPHINEKLSIHLFSEVDSTSRYLKSLKTSNAIDVCLSEQQTQGRGRFSRAWYSPFGQNIYCSIRWRFDCSLSDLAGLGLIVSLATVKALLSYEPKLLSQIAIKWPNDVYIAGKKLSGSLIEVSAENNDTAEVIVGIGLNVNMQQDNQTIEAPWCSLSQVLPSFHNRNTIVALLLQNLIEHIQMPIGAELFHQWQAYDYLYGKNITVKNHDRITTGIAQGIDQQGHLLLRSSDNTIQKIASGDATLSKV